MIQSAKTQDSTPVSPVQKVYLHLAAIPSNTYKRGSYALSSPIYTPSRGDELIAICSKGYSLSYVAAHWGIARSTLYRWRKLYPDFDDACERGITNCMAYYDTILREVMLGQRQVNVRIFLFRYRALFSNVLRDEKELELHR